MKKCCWIILLISGLALAGCSPWVRTEQAGHAETIAVVAGGSVGQTFMARYNGLAGVAVYLSPGTASSTGTITLDLRRGPDSGDTLVRARLPLESVAGPGFYRFEFPPLEESTGQDFYAELAFEGQGEVAIGRGDADSYLNGAFYQDGQPQEAQMTFRLRYEPALAAPGLLAEGITWLARLAAGGFIFLLPGWALLRLLLRTWLKLAWPEKLGLAGGAGLAIYPLLFLWTDLVGLHLGPIYAWGPPLAALVSLVWINVRQWPARGQHHSAAFHGEKHGEADSPQEAAGLPPTPQGFTGWIACQMPYLVLAFLLGLIFFVRLWTIRSLEAPMLGDGYQHTLIAQLLVDHGGLFDSWAPYAELSTFTYHFGFHTAVAVYHWVTGLSLAQAALWTGQILNGLAVLSLYPLAARLGRSPWSGVLAVLVAGLLASMPMVYVNWSRYTQLSGQVILGAAAYLIWVLLGKQRTRDLRLAGLVGLVLGGLALTHYRVLVFAGLLLAAGLPLALRRDGLPSRMWNLVLSAASAGVLFLPWFIHVFGGKILGMFVAQVSTPANPASNAAQTVAFQDPFIYLPGFLWLLLALAFGWGIWRRERGAAWLGFWCLLTLLAANPQWFGLPGAGAIDSFAVLIAAYFPAGILLGAAAGWCLETLSLQRARSVADKGQIRSAALWVNVLLAVAALGLGVAGGRLRLREVHPADYALVTRPDVRAAGWIQRETRPEARFLVNTFFAFNDTTVVGSDAGWWLPLLSGRSTTLPPINYAYEAGPMMGDLPLVNALTAQIQQAGLGSQEARELLKALRVTHLYIGQQQGKVNYTGPHRLDPQALQLSGGYRLVYRQDRVWIFEILP